MACFHPLTGYKALSPNSSGKFSIVFNRNLGKAHLKITVPCGQCIGCKLERSKQWAVRCIHEASLYDENCFLTLTYNPEHLPAHGTLVKKHYQDFMKRLRAKFPEKKIRYFQCGEYGEKSFRPHYHACLFGFDFQDKKKWKTHNGQQYYTSETLEKLWPFGHSTIGEVTFESAAYVARYITKKITGPLADEHYETIDVKTGEIHQRLPEYVTMSRRPGIGKPWLEKFERDVYPHDFLVIRNGVKVKPPKYYNQIFSSTKPEEYELIQNRRKKGAFKHAPNNSHERLKVREFLQYEKLSKLKRSYENED